MTRYLFHLFFSDISLGKEKIPVSCINEVSKTFVFFLLLNFFEQGYKDYLFSREKIYILFYI